MRIRDGETEYVVHLTYLNELGNRAVTARVHAGKCFEPWSAEQDGTCQRKCGVGTAVCNPKDQYVRATGRKVALGRALRALGLDWETRARIWAEYLRPANVHALAMTETEQRVLPASAGNIAETPAVSAADRRQIVASALEAQGVDLCGPDAAIAVDREIARLDAPPGCL